MTFVASCLTNPIREQGKSFKCQRMRYLMIKNDSELNFQGLQRRDRHFLHSRADATIARHQHERSRVSCPISVSVC